MAIEVSGKFGGVSAEPGKDHGQSEVSMSQDPGKPAKSLVGLRPPQPGKALDIELEME
jgi:hypothetical protein